MTFAKDLAISTVPSVEPSLTTIHSIFLSPAAEQIESLTAKQRVSVADIAFSSFRAGITTVNVLFVDEIMMTV